MSVNTPTTDWTFTTKVHFRSATKGRKRMHEGERPAPPSAPAGRIPRIARLLALAHRYAALVESGDVRDCADVARLAGVSRARVTQIMNLLHLAPDIQEAILDLPRTLDRPDSLRERDLRPIAATPDWPRQRVMWNGIGARQRRDRVER